MKSRVQKLAEKINLICDEFIGEMREKATANLPTAINV
jgi:hypothetical protein